MEIIGQGPDDFGLHRPNAFRLCFLAIKQGAGFLQVGGIIQFGEPANKRL
jgi:hypothetical protein